jgi:hypothetical protein
MTEILLNEFDLKGNAAAAARSLLGMILLKSIGR